MIFPRALAQNEMQRASFSIWTEVTDSIPNTDNCYGECAFSD